MNIAIVKYNAGNTRSVLCALHRLGYEAKVTDDPGELANADKVIFPGWEKPLLQWHILGRKDWIRYLPP